MKVAIYSLTRDRLDYTKHCFQTLKERAGYPYDHFIVDNGSDRDTIDWLVDHSKDFEKIILEEDNTGISRASNLALDYIADGDYDLICKMDNDCEVKTPGIVRHMVDFYMSLSEPMLVSPSVVGINNQPSRAYSTKVGIYTVGRTGIVGGLCHWLSAETYQQFRYPTELPLAWGQDDAFCDWAYHRGIGIGYIESLKVNHYETTDGQVLRYPEYFKRKKLEEGR